MNLEKRETTKGEVCPNEMQSDRKRVRSAVRWSKVRSIVQKCTSRFHVGAYSATVGVASGRYLSNAG